MRLIRMAVLAAGVAAAVGACGGSGAPARSAAGTTSSASTPPTITTTATVTSTPATGQGSTTAVATATPGAPTGTGQSSDGGVPAGGPAPCRAAGLRLTFLGQQGATGHGEIGFALRNVGGQSCGTGGYPGVLFLDRAGGALPTDPTRSTTDYFGSSPERALIVAPGQSFSFRLVVGHGSGSGANCATAAALQVIAPNDTVPLRAMIPGGAFECAAATVSPVQPGSSAYL